MQCLNHNQQCMLTPQFRPPQVLAIDSCPLPAIPPSISCLTSVTNLQLAVGGVRVCLCDAAESSRTSPPHAGVPPGKSLLHTYSWPELQASLCRFPEAPSAPLSTLARPCPLSLRYRTRS